jgi:CBS-domain-containing membrane protein
MRSPAELLPPELSIGTARERIVQGDILVGDGERLLGIVLAAELDEAFINGSAARTLEMVMRPSSEGRIPHVHPDHQADLVLHRLAQSEMSVLPVLDRRDITKILGQVTLRDLMAAYRAPVGPRS